MPEITSQIHALLSTLDAAVYYQYPAGFAAFPCAIFYESGSEVYARADNAPHLHLLEFTVECWAKTAEGARALSAEADELLSSLGLSRSYACDLYDGEARAHRRVARYRAVCDSAGVLTQ